MSGKNHFSSAKARPIAGYALSPPMSGTESPRERRSSGFARFLRSEGDVKQSRKSIRHDGDIAGTVRRPSWHTQHSLPTVSNDDLEKAVVSPRTSTSSNGVGGSGRADAPIDDDNTKRAARPSTTPIPPARRSSFSPLASPTSATGTVSTSLPPPPTSAEWAYSIFLRF